MIRLGSTQRKVLEALRRNKGWNRNCGWMWTTHFGTEKYMNQLFEKGLVSKQGGPHLFHYKINNEGIKVLEGLA